MTLSERIDEVQSELRALVTEAFDVAYAIEEPAGTSDAWDAICARFAIERLEPSQRPGVLATQRPHRGAPVFELHNVAKTIEAQSRRALKKIDVWDAPGPVERAHESLRRFIERMPDELLSAYKKAVLPERKGMFANVLTHQTAGKGQPTGGSAHALRCTTCGAPRLDAESFECGFCGNDMVK